MPPVYHSPFGASGAYRWMTCPGSVALSAKAPQKKSSGYANEGSAAHELAEMSIRQMRMPDKFIGELIVAGDEAFEVTPEMAEFVSEYVREILKVGSRANNPNLVDKVRVETKFTLDWVGRSGMFGTCDASLADTANRKLHVFDLKYGEATPVVAEENMQLMYYALGILGFEGPEKFDTVRLVIVQPRCLMTGTTEWEISVEDLLRWKDEKLIPAVDAAIQKDAPFHPSEKACQWCAGKPICPALGNQITESCGLALTDKTEAFEAIQFPDPEKLTDDQISKILMLMPLVKPFFDSVAEMALDRAMKGDVIEGFKLVQGRRGNRQWVDEKAVKEAFAFLGDDLFEKKLLSPNKLEKMLPKDRRDEVESFTTRSEPKLSLAPLSDKRTAVVLETVSVLNDVYGKENAVKND